MSLLEQNTLEAIVNNDNNQSDVNELNSADNNDLTNWHEEDYATLRAIYEAECEKLPVRWSVLYKCAQGLSNSPVESDCICAAEIAQRLIDVGYSPDAALLVQCSALIQCKRYVRARQCLNQLLKLNPDDTHVLEIQQRLNLNVQHGNT